MNEDVERARLSENGQLRLFPAKPRDICNLIQLNWIAALKLYNDGLLSFNPADEKKLNEAQETELIFLGSLIVAGCDEMMLEQMLKTLQKPYQYRVDQIYYDWKSQRWRIFPHLKEKDRELIVREWLEDLDKGQFLFDWINDVEMEHIFEGWIDDLLNSGDIDQLVNIEKACQEAIFRLREE
jgi:hypothetical protein